MCVDQSLWQALGALVFSHRKLCLDSLGISVPHAVRSTLFLLRHKLFRSAHATVTLPVFGHIAIRVHRGFKAFDLGNVTVTKVFADDVPESEARQELLACQQASKIKAAPRFIAADPGCAWYTEEFVVGVHGTLSDTAQSGRFMQFYADVETCLMDLLDTSPAVTVETRAHIDDLTGAEDFQAWDEAPIAADVVAEIRHFQQQVRRWLLGNLEAPQLQLVPSHGDFALVNVIIAADGFRVIDWEGVQPGGLYDDCFNFILAERYYGRAKPDVSGEMAEIHAHYGAAVVQRYPGLRVAAELSLEIAVRLYYLERLRLLLRRDVSVNLIGVIRKSLQMFREFDADAGFGWIPSAGQGDETKVDT